MTTLPEPTPLNPDRVPHRVPTVSQNGPRATASRPCPTSHSPTEWDTVSEPSRPCPATVSQPWFQPHQITWTYQSQTNPSRQAQVRLHACPTCGAPSNARCVTKTGAITPNHGQRGRLAHGICCQGIGATHCPKGRQR